MRSDTFWTRKVLAAAAVAVALAFGAAQASKPVKLTLTPTSKAPPKAQGRTVLAVKHAKGKFALMAKHLAPGKAFDLVVGGVKVGTFTSSAGGSGKLKFSTKPRGSQSTLGFDPEGEGIEVREEDDGDDDLVGDMPPGDSASGACCIAGHDGETECEDLSDADCTHAGGTPAGTASCIPNPCGAGEHHDVVCCIAGSTGGAFTEEDPETECEETSEAECAHHGGTAMSATSCEPDPCAPTPPPAHVACCVPDEGETECESMTPENCTAHGGTDSGAASCDAHPCGGGDGGGGGGGDGGGDDGDGHH